MKKIISILLAVIMTAALLCAAVPAFAAEYDVVVYYNGEEICEATWAEAVDIIKTNLFGKKGEVANYKLKLLKNLELKATFNPQNDVNIEIDGLLANGQKATITSTVTGNNWRLEGGGKYVFRNVNIVGQPTAGCLIQLNHITGGDLDIIDSTITSTEDLYYTINAMAKNGDKQTINIIRSTITQSTATGGALISTGNPNDHYMHLEINVIDSTLKTNAKVIQVNAGSTTEVNLVNSVLEIADPGAKATAGIVISAVENLKGVEGLPSANVINSTNSLIKSGTLPTVNAADGANLTNNYQVGEPNTEVTSPIEDLEIGLPEIITEAPTTTTAPDDEEDDATTTTASEDEEDDVTTTKASDEEDDEEDDETTPADEEDDVTTATPDNTTAAPDVTTAAPATDAEGGCAGCAAGDGATAAIALVVAMAAAVAIIVKRK